MRLSKELRLMATDNAVSGSRQADKIVVPQRLLELNYNFLSFIQITLCIKRSLRITILCLHRELYTIFSIVSVLQAVSLFRKLYCPNLVIFKSFPVGEPVDFCPKGLLIRQRNLCLNQTSKRNESYLGKKF